MEKKYKKYEFCKDIDCPYFVAGSCQQYDDLGCVATAKDFHKWLNKNGYKIIKK